jgi:hypothetical protein
MLSHFERRRRELLAFIEENGRFPDSSENLSERQLDDWILEQRRRYARLAEKYRGLDDWVRALEAVPGWTWESVWIPTPTTTEVSPWARGPREGAAALSTSWRNSYIRLRASATDHSRLPIAADDVALAGWVRRHQLLRRAGGLDIYRAELLESVPFWSWDSELRPDDSKKHPRSLWLANYGRILDFVEEHDRLPGYQDDPPLRAWLLVYVGQYRRGELDQGKRELLELIPTELTI